MCINLLYNKYLTKTPVSRKWCTGIKVSELRTTAHVQADLIIYTLHVLYALCRILQEEAHIKAIP